MDNVVRFGVSIEKDLMKKLSAYMKKKGYRVKEMPVSWIDSPRSRVHILRHSMQMFVDVLKIKYLHR